MKVYPEVCQLAIWELDICQHPNCQLPIWQFPNSNWQPPECRSFSADGRLMTSAKNPTGITEAKRRLFDYAQM